MNNIEYIFECHDLTKEVVMVQVRDNPDAPWSVPIRLVIVFPMASHPFICVGGSGFPEGYRFARLAKQTVKPWTLKTAPRHLEVELEKGFFYVAFIKTEYLVTFLKGGERHHLTWQQLTSYKQWDGSPCGEVVE